MRYKLTFKKNESDGAEPQKIYSRLLPSKGGFTPPVLLRFNDEQLSDLPQYSWEIKELESTIKKIVEKHFLDLTYEYYNNLLWEPEDTNSCDEIIVTLTDTFYPIMDKKGDNLVETGLTTNMDYLEFNIPIKTIFNIDRLDCKFNNLSDVLENKIAQVIKNNVWKNRFFQIK